MLLEDDPGVSWGFGKLARRDHRQRHKVVMPLTCWGLASKARYWVGFIVRSKMVKERFQSERGDWLRLQSGRSSCKYGLRPLGSLSSPLPPWYSPFHPSHTPALLSSLCTAFRISASSLPLWAPSYFIFLQFPFTSPPSNNAKLMIPLFLYQDSLKFISSSNFSSMVHC